MRDGVDPGAGIESEDRRRCNVRHALPRHFLYPSLLLLLTEAPSHGYRLVDALGSLGFGSVDRPSVYRALADLEGDGLLEATTAPPLAGSTRHVYSVTARGAAVLDMWMGVVGRQRDCLDLVLTRYVKASAIDDVQSLPMPQSGGGLAAAMSGSWGDGGNPTH